MTGVFSSSGIFGICFFCLDYQDARNPDKTKKNPGTLRSEFFNWFQCRSFKSKNCRTIFKELPLNFANKFSNIVREIHPSICLK